MMSWNPTWSGLCDDCKATVKLLFHIIIKLKILTVTTENCINTFSIQIKNQQKNKAKKLPTQSCAG